MFAEWTVTDAEPSSAVTLGAQHGQRHDSDRRRIVAWSAAGPFSRSLQSLRGEGLHFACDGKKKLRSLLLDTWADDT